MFVNFVKVPRNHLKIFGFDLLHQYPLAVFLCVAIVLSGLHKTFAAPRNVEDDNEWWKNPCAKSVQIRHGRSPSQNQLRNFISKIDNPILKRLSKLYPHGRKVKSKGNCVLKVGKMMKPIKNATNTVSATAYFYSTMLQIAQYMNKLKNVKINSSAQSNVSERNDIYNIAKWNLRLVLCEFNETLDKWEITAPRVPKISTKCLGGRMDLTSTQLIDIDFFNKLKKFFNQSFTAFKRLKKRQPNKNKKEGRRKN